jgi:hypothetical protein
MTGGGPSRRYFSVNFDHLRRHHRESTIEFRRAPATTEANEIQAWAEFVMGFVQAALVMGTFRKLKKYGRDVSGLRRFLDAGLSPDASLSSYTFLDSIFDEKSGSLETLVYDPAED